MYNPGDVILASVQFTDTYEVKTRPAVVLYEEFDNIVVAGVTSNTAMKGIPLSIKEGAAKASVIKLNYLFTISRALVKKKLFSLSKEKKKIVYEEMTARLNAIKE